MQYFATLLLAALAFGYCGATQAQAPPESQRQSPQATLTEFEGRYAYRDGLSLFMVESHGQLVAIIDQSKYLLRPAGPDVFLNPPGDSIPFIRDSTGRVVAFKEYGERFARLSSDVPISARSLLEARARGPDGSLLDYRYESPKKLADGIAVGKATSASLWPELFERLVNAVGDGTYPDVHSILVHHKGVLLLEEYFYGFDRDRPHEMRSFTKSVISLLVGVAVDRGLLRADESALQRLGYARPRNFDPRKSRITVSQLLSNQSGLACNEYDRSSPGKETNLFETADWVRAFFDVPMAADPGTVGSYCSGGFYAAGRLVELATGKSLPEFADEVLFAPLGIARNRWKWSFVLDRSHRNDFGQLSLAPRDMLKLGILISNRGVWKDKRVVSAAWIDASVAHRSRVDDSDYGLGLWHRWYQVNTSAGNQRVDTIMLSGNGGQKVYIVPSVDLIVVSTGNAFFVDSPLNEMLSRVLLPALLAAPMKR